MKARVLAAALDGRVIGAADAEISRAVHPAEAASCATAMSRSRSHQIQSGSWARAERRSHSFRRSACSSHIQRFQTLT